MSIHTQFSTLAELLLQANEARQRRDYPTALSIYYEALKRFGESAELFSAIASCYHGLALYQPGETGENHRAAVEWSRRAVERSPADSRLHTQLAEYYALGLLNYEKAAEEYRESIRQNPNDVEALVGAASLYGLPEGVVTLGEAINWLERATQLDPWEPVYHARLGQLYCEAGNRQAAEQEWYSALLGPRPLDPGYVAMLKAVLAGQGDACGEGTA